MKKEQLRMQMLAGIITESQYKAKLNEITLGKYPIYELINDMHDEIFQNTGVDGKIKPYGSIPFVPAADDDDFTVILYTKGDQQIAVGCDFDYGVSPDGDERSVWNVDVNENVDYDFGEDLSFDETVNAVTEWLES
jgi:hypothetical protein